MGNFIESKGFVTLMGDGSVKVPRSRQTCRFPSGFLGYDKLQTHSVGLASGIMMFSSTISCNFTSILPLNSWNFYDVCCMGFTLGSVLMYNVWAYC